MNHFAALLDRLSFEPSRNGKLRLMVEYFRQTPDPERGFALAALTGALSFRHAKPAIIRALISQRVDPVLFNMSYDYVGDLSETVALLWGDGAAPHHGTDSPAAGKISNNPPLALSEVVAALDTAGKADLPVLLSGWLDRLDETGRWALLKLITGGLRVGVSARLAKTAVARLGGLEPDAAEQVWHGLVPPYGPLFAWVEGRAEMPVSRNPAPFRPAMLAQPLNETSLSALDPAAYAAEWKWDGIRLQASAGHSETGIRVLRLYTRTGEEVTQTFPDLAEALAALPMDAFTLDGELLVIRDGRVQNFGQLQIRLNRKSVNARLLADYPVYLRAYDLLSLNGEDLRTTPFMARRILLEDFISKAANPRLDISDLIPFSDWDSLAHVRKSPESAGAGHDAAAVEGIMLKRHDSPYISGRPTGPWYKWKRDPFIIDTVLMYARRGHGKRSSFYSDFTFGVWREDTSGSGEPGSQLVPVGKAYFGFTDEELVQLDRYVRNHTTERYGPVRVVEHKCSKGLVLEVAFEGLNRSARHKSGVAMRFPRISRIRWDKPPAEADRLETLEALLREPGNADL